MNWNGLWEELKRAYEIIMLLMAITFGVIAMSFITMSFVVWIGGQAVQCLMLSALGRSCW